MAVDFQFGAVSQDSVTLCMDLDVDGWRLEVKHNGEDLAVLGQDRVGLLLGGLGPPLGLESLALGAHQPVTLGQEVPQALLQGLDAASLEEAIGGRYEGLRQMVKSEDFVEGPRSFAEKRVWRKRQLTLT